MVETASWRHPRSLGWELRGSRLLVVGDRWLGFRLFGPGVGRQTGQVSEKGRLSTGSAGRRKLCGLGKGSALSALSPIT